MSSSYRFLSWVVTFDISLYAAYTALMLCTYLFPDYRFGAFVARSALQAYRYRITISSLLGFYVFSRPVFLSSAGIGPRLFSEPTESLTFRVPLRAALSRRRLGLKWPLSHDLESFRLVLSYYATASLFNITICNYMCSRPHRRDLRFGGALMVYYSCRAKCG